ncbi:MAG: hypothetical protein ACHQ0Y_04665 [Thermodesulfovibrionales bacterium]
MKRTTLVLILTCMLAFAGSSQAMMGSGGSGISGGTGMMPGGTAGTYMQMPMAQQMFEYGPTTGPVMGTDIANSMPIGVGSVAMGGNMITVHAAIGQFSGPMDMYLTAYAPAVDPFTVYLMHPDGTLKPVSMGFEPWIAGVTSIDQTPITNMPTSSLPKGTYTVGLMATPTGGNMSTYYLWTTHFVVQ